jgi:hypothetical protein
MKSQRGWRSIVAPWILVPALGAPAPGQSPCSVPDNGAGTIDLPPAGCGYVSPQDLHLMIDGLPPGTTIRAAAEHLKFFRVEREAGGSLAGEIERFDSFLFLELQGSGELEGFTRTLGIQAQCETHTGPRSLASRLQAFPADMFRLQGQIAGDPDFDLLRVTAGTGFGLASPGQTILERQPGGDWSVDSSFDITYRIDFVGAPGGALEGLSGSTIGTVAMKAGVTIDIPPEVLFQRGDSNGDGRRDIGDPIFTLNWQFRGGQAPSCLDAADSNDDGRSDISDVIYDLAFQFTGGPAPPPPGPAICGPDPTEDRLDCEAYPPCGAP